jgi:hypothetical protein
MTFLKISQICFIKFCIIIFFCTYFLILEKNDSTFATSLVQPIEIYSSAVSKDPASGVLNVLEPELLTLVKPEPQCDDALASNLIFIPNPHCFKTKSKKH